MGLGSRARHNHLLLLLLRRTRQKVDTRMGIELSPRQAIYDIVKAVELGDITRYQANEFIIDVLLNIPPHPATEEGINS